MPSFQAISLATFLPLDPVSARAVDLLRRVVSERGAVRIVDHGMPASDTLHVTLALEPGIGTEGYRIADTPDGGLLIAGNDPNGLLYGIGRFLHEVQYDSATITPGAWRGVSVPQCSIRGMYFALHNNFYSMAPREELQRYIDDLALWGINTLCFHLPQFENPTTPEAQARQHENHELLQAARRSGMKVALMKEPNIGFYTAPAEILAPEFPDTDPARRGFAGTRICPSDPAGFAYLSRMLDDYLAGYEDIGLDFVVAFPYDSGGCGCEQCWPWGARGYLTISREFARLTRIRYPQCRFILGTWCFDVMDTSDGEFAGLDAVLAQDKHWVDVIMADAHEDFPAYPLEHGAPGSLPMINFAEISMWGRFPWGGFGANPLPARYQRLWDQSKHLMSGGLPYSEGNFEDINKIIYAHFFWDKAISADDAIRAYIGYEYSPAVVDLVLEAITLLEQNYPRHEWTRERADRAWALLQRADALLPAYAKTSWRWRILYLRALIDVELLANNNEVSDRCDAAYEELLHIFHLEDGWHCVAPPSRAFRARKAAKDRGEISGVPPGADQGMVGDTASSASSEALPPGAVEGMLR